MAFFRPEPPYTHGSPARVGVLLVNLGTPAAPTAQALRPYLQQFLWDRRVVELPRLLWWMILHGRILRTRPAASAEKYASIWSPEGSPLAMHTARQAKLLAGYLGEGGHPDLHVAWAMRYGAPSIPDSLDAMKKAGVTRVLVVPLYPQYAAQTTASTHDEVCRWMLGIRNQPELRLLRNFHDNPAYIAALAASVREHWMKHGRGERLVISFHGVPKECLLQGDPYHCECQKTARLLTEALELAPEQALITFQSRFGRTEWLQPYTQPTLEQLARDGVGHVDVICPGFVSDCVETLEEIAIECRDAFVAHGGKRLEYIPCLNERHDWITALAWIVREHLGNWLQLPQRSTEEQEEARRRAIALGAPR